jgi:acyl-CoA thioesterase-1
MIGGSCIGIVFSYGVRTLGVGLPVPCGGRKNMGRRRFMVFLGAAATAWRVTAQGIGFGRGGPISAFMLLFITAANAAPLRIVAVGASNTSGWLISEQSAYPAVLQEMLREKGVEAQITNAGVPFDTTSKMLARIDSDIPEGTQIVILQPGGNDLRFLGSREQRSANITMMIRLLQARSIKVIVYDEEIPWKYVFDGIHLTPTGHRMIAAFLLPKVMALPMGNPLTGRPARKLQE